MAVYLSKKVAWLTHEHFSIPLQCKPVKGHSVFLHILRPVNVFCPSSRVAVWDALSQQAKDKRL